MALPPIGSRRGVVYVLVGLALVLGPAVVDAVGADDPDSFTYEPKEVTFYDNGTYDLERAAGRLDSEVACFERAPSRSCVVERAVHANGGIVYDGLHEIKEKAHDFSRGMNPTTRDTNHPR